MREVIITEISLEKARELFEDAVGECAFAFKGDEVDGKYDYFYVVEHFDDENCMHVKSFSAGNMGNEAGIFTPTDDWAVLASEEELTPDLREALRQTGTVFPGEEQPIEAFNRIARGQ